jgi:glycine cleavage system aminomethyltransferase T
MDFFGREAYVAQRERNRQPAYLCTLTMQGHTDSRGVDRFPVGQWPLLDPSNGDVLRDELGRRSYTTSIAFGPSVGKTIAMGYLPYSHCKEGNELVMEYFAEHFPVKVEAVGNKPLYDPTNERARS